MHCVFTTQNQNFCHHVFDPSYYFPTRLLSGTAILLSVTLGFCLLVCCVQFYIPHYEWNHMVLNFFSSNLTLLSMIFSRSVPLLNGSISSFLWPCSLPLYTRATSSLSSHPSKGSLVVSMPWALWVMLRWM